MSFWLKNATDWKPCLGPTYSPFLIISKFSGIFPPKWIRVNAQLTELKREREGNKRLGRKATGVSWILDWRIRELRKLIFWEIRNKDQNSTRLETTFGQICFFPVRLLPENGSTSFKRRFPNNWFKPFFLETPKPVLHRLIMQIAILRRSHSFLSAKVTVK